MQQQTIRGVVILVAALVVAACASQPSHKETMPSEGGVISTEALMSTVAQLAAPGMEGRLSGGPGYDRAAAEMAGRFEALGLEPGLGDSFLQEFEVEVNEITSPSRVEVVHEGESVAFEHGRDFIARGFSGASSVRAPVVFCGYGLSFPEKGFDEYDGVDVKGKIVVAFKDPPQWTLDDDGWEAAAMPRPKAASAAAHGAVALLLVGNPSSRFGQRPYGSVVHGPGEQDPDFPQVHVGERVIERLLAGSGVTLSELETSINESQQPRSMELSVTALVEVTASYRSEAKTANVVAILRGSDLDLAEEHLVLGAHLDHVGRHGDLLFPGAHDNASGVAAVMAMAKAFATDQPPPRRTLVFVLFAAEEQGLLGARHYVDHPALPLDGAVAMFNFDCIGRGDGIKLGSGEAYPELWQLARSIDQANGGLMVEETWWGGGADAQPFFDAGVATLYFNTTNGYDHIHQPSDTPERLNPDVFTAITRLAHLTAAAVADGQYNGEERQPRG